MTPELEARITEARAIAVDKFGMDPGDVRFIVAPAHIMYATAAHGLPGMWSHWSDGKEYWIYKAQHDAGAMRIYEMVVNTEPRLALLLDSNPDITNVMVAAHVQGWVDDAVDVRLPGGTLRIEWSGEGNVTLTGPAQQVFESEWTR